MGGGGMARACTRQPSAGADPPGGGAGPQRLSELVSDWEERVQEEAQAKDEEVKEATEAREVRCSPPQGGGRRTAR